MKVKSNSVLLTLVLLVACNGQSTGTASLPSMPEPSKVVVSPSASSAPTPAPSPTPACSPIFNVIGFWPDSEHILGLLTVEGRVTTWLQVLDLPSQQPKTILEVDQFTNVAALSPDRQVLAWALPDFSIQLIRLRDGQIISALTGHTGAVNSLVFSPDGERLYSGSADTFVKVWDVSGKLLHSFQPDGADNLPAEVMGMGISPDGSHLITIPAEGNAKVWTTADYKKVGEYQGAIFGAYNGAKALYSPDGKFIAVGLAAGPGAASVWRSADNVMVWNGGFMSDFDFSSDKRYFAHTQLEDNIQLIVIGSADGQTTFQKIRPSSEEMVWKLLFSPDSTKLVSVANGLVNIWNVEDGKLLKTYTVPCP
jgi:WD40 repeat protein